MSLNAQLLGGCDKSVCRKNGSGCEECLESPKERLPVIPFPKSAGVSDPTIRMLLRDVGELVSMSMKQSSIPRSKRFKDADKEWLHRPMPP